MGLPLNFLVSKSTALYLMSHQLVLTSKDNCSKRLLSVQVTTTLVSLAGLTPSITITTTTNQTGEAQVHTQPVCAFRSTQPVTHSNSAHQSSTSARGVFPADQRTWHLLLHLKMTNVGVGGGVIHSGKILDCDSSTVMLR